LLKTNAFIRLFCQLLRLVLLSYISRVIRSKEKEGYGQERKQLVRNGKMYDQTTSTIR
jgi:hypothetical protein